MATQAFKLCSGNLASVDRSLMTIDVWKNESRRMDISTAFDSSCPCCVMRRFEHFEAKAGDGTTSLCGRNGVQIRPKTKSPVQLEQVCERLKKHGEFELSGGALKGVFRDERSPSSEIIEFILFADGRAIITGDTDTVWARAFYDRFIGS
jgi:adenylyltransferase/sulfurtransferase